MENLYAKYADRVGDLLRNGPKRGQRSKSMQTFSKANDAKNMLHLNESQDEMMYKSLKPFEALTDQMVKYDQRPGAHPEFINIRDGVTEYHYITSVFIDIKRSTGLFSKYDPYTVANITDTIQKAAIHTCWQFGGYVQRFHGDGLFIYFGGRAVTIPQSAVNAINATSFFTYFVKNNLKDLFYEQGIENIYIRTGIDTGEAEDVLWYKAGVGDCGEITTCSLHTSLAAHMQGNASSNGIMIGDNVKKYANLSPELYAIKKDSQGKEDRYIYQIPEENFNYTQWVFNWERYVNTHSKVKVGIDGRLYMEGAAPTIIEPQKNMDYLRQQVHGYKPYFK